MAKLKVRKLKSSLSQIVNYDDAENPNPKVPAVDLLAQNIDVVLPYLVVKRVELSKTPEGAQNSREGTDPKRNDRRTKRLAALVEALADLQYEDVQDRNADAGGPLAADLVPLYEAIRHRQMTREVFIGRLLAVCTRHGLPAGYLEKLALGVNAIKALGGPRRSAWAVQTAVKVTGASVSTMKRAATRQRREAAKNVKGLQNRSYEAIVTYIAEHLLRFSPEECRQIQVMFRIGPLARSAEEQRVASNKLAKGNERLLFGREFAERGSQSAAPKPRRQRVKRHVGTRRR